MRVLALEWQADLFRELAALGADRESWPIFETKHRSFAVKVDRISTAGANILKQVAIACGADCAVHRAVASGRVRTSGAVLFLSRRQLGFLTDRLRRQPACASWVASELTELDKRYWEPELTMRIGRRKLDLGARTYVMGILNITPDSFYDGGRYLDPEQALARAVEIEAEGADFIDIGAESTRPGSVSVSPSEQVKRLGPLLASLARRTRIPISVDTTSGRVAEYAIGAGASIVNDTSGFARDRRMAGVVAKAGVPCILMHIKGTPKTMQQDPKYGDLMAEILARLEAAVEVGIRAGVKREQIVVDPGIGFGKRPEHNLEIIRRLGELRSLGRPILVGASRKSFIGKTLNLEPSERIEAGLAAGLAAVRNGANILRVHDVRATVRAVQMADAIEGRG